MCRKTRTWRRQGVAALRRQRARRSTGRARVGTRGKGGRLSRRTRHEKVPSRKTKGKCTYRRRRLSSMCPRGVRPLPVTASTPPLPRPRASPSWSYWARYRSKRRVHDDVLSSPLLPPAPRSSAASFPSLRRCCRSSFSAPRALLLPLLGEPWSAAESGYAPSGVGARSSGG